MLVIALTKHEPSVGTAYVIVGTLVGNTENEISLIRAASPIITEKYEIQFKQHIVPNEFLNTDYLSNVKTVLNKSFLSFFVLIDEKDPHPIVEKYNEFWDESPYLDEIAPE